MYKIPEKLNKNKININNYDSYIKNSKTNGFWSSQANELIDWEKQFETESDIDLNNAKIKWFLNGKLNVCYNCVDRHAKKDPEKTAIIWEKNDTSFENISYGKLYQEVCNFAGFLKQQGVKKGDRVCLYMPMIPEAVYAMLACARIGAIHSFVFAGFSAESLKSRVEDCQVSLLVTADYAFRGNKSINLLEIVRNANVSVPTAVVVRDINTKLENEIDYFKFNKNPYYEYEIMDSEDPLFILYTSGSTGKPKGLIHTSAGYLTYAIFTYDLIFNYEKNDIHFCAADLGWITGHTYTVYGVLGRGATTVLFEGLPNFPDPSRYWQVIDRHSCSSFYTAPTAIRALMKEDLSHINKYNLNSLKVIGSVGEPINPEAWNWYYRNISKGNAAVVDTWWQTETGGIQISCLPTVNIPKPGSACLPLPGITTKIEDGKLLLETVNPGHARGIWGDQDRFKETYFSEYPGYYFAGDACEIDEDGFHWITGRVDDVINSSGHRIGSAEIESAAVAVGVQEAAAIGFPHSLKGEGIAVFCVANFKDPNIVNQGIELEIGRFARADKIFFVSGLPKTRSGKIMRRILKKIINHDYNLGDLSTLANPEVVEEIKEQLS